MTPASLTDTVLGMEPSATRASIWVWTSWLTLPVSTVVISAEIEAAGAWSTRVIVPWASTCSTVAILPSGSLTAVPTGIALSSSTVVTDVGSTCTNTAVAPGSSGSVTVVAVAPTSIARTACATWALVMPTMIALFGSGVTWISGVPFDRSLLRLSRSLLPASAVMTTSFAAATCAGSSPEIDDGQVVGR